MANTLQRRKATIKSNTKSIPIEKTPKKPLSVEFRWSTTIIKFSPTENDPLLNFHPLDLDNTEQKEIISITPPSIPNSSSLPADKSSPSSPRLPAIIDPTKKKKISEENNTNNNAQSSPLSLTYSQLHHAQIPLQPKKKSRPEQSLLPVINEKRNTHSLHHALASQSPSKQPPTNDKYIRLQTSQLRRLNVSSKYLKEAKKLYFNPALKVFVPRHSIIEMI